MKFVCPVLKTREVIDVSDGEIFVGEVLVIEENTF
jgi:hypothetical protein